MTAIPVPALVQQLLRHESEQGQSPHNSDNPQGHSEAARRVCEKLRIHLSARIGRDGFRILLTRAVGLAAAQFPHLNVVCVTPDGTLQGLGSFPQSGSEEAPEDPHAIAEGGAAILTHLLDLLVTFIGDTLTRRMLSTLWPFIDLSPADSHVPGESRGTDPATDTTTGTGTKGRTLGREEDMV
jgi:hypothetical protein